MRNIILPFCFLFLHFISSAQADTSFFLRLKSLDTANTLKADTAAVANDRLTQKIKLLRSERSGLTTESVIKMKISEEQEKDTAHSKYFYKKLTDEITTGKTGKLIETSLINLYRRNFTESEIDDLIKFYKTPAGKKMNKEFILLTLQSIKDAEQLLKIAAKNLQLKE